MKQLLFVCMWTGGTVRCHFFVRSVSHTSVCEVGVFHVQVDIQGFWLPVVCEGMCLVMTVCC